MSILKNLLVLFILINVSVLSGKPKTKHVFASGFGRIYIGYNEKPDSILVDGSKVILPPKNTLEIQEGPHIIKAYLSCYKTIEDTIEVKRGRLGLVRLKFERFTTSEYNSYKNIRLQSYLTSLPIVLISPFLEGGYSTLMPIGLIGLTGQVIWQLKQGSYFNHCNGEYFGPNLKTSMNNFFFGIVTRVGNEFKLDYRDSFIKTYETPNTPIGIERYLKQEIVIAPNDDPLSSWGFSFAYQKELNRKYHFSFQMDIYPYLTTRAVLYDENNIFADFITPRKKADRKNVFVIFGANLDYKFVDRQNFIMYFSFGAIKSNTISEKIGLEVMHPDIAYFDENPPMAYYDYSYSVTGISLGVKTNYLFTDKFSYNMIYRIQYAQMLTLNNESSRGLLINIGVNFVYSM